MGHDARKPVFGGLRTTKAHTNLPIHAVLPGPLLFAYWKVSYLDLLRTKFQFSSLVSVADETGLKFALSETPKTGFLTPRPKCS